jgi:hypothetical protein
MLNREKPISYRAKGKPKSNLLMVKLCANKNLTRAQNVSHKNKKQNAQIG